MLLVAAGVLVARAYPTDPDVESPCGFDVVNGADTGFKYEYGVEGFYEGAMAGNFPGFTYGHPPCQQVCTGNRMGELRDDSHDNYMRTANGYQITDILCQYVNSEYKAKAKAKESLNQRQSTPTQLSSKSNINRTVS